MQSDTRLTALQRNPQPYPNRAARVHAVVRYQSAYAVVSREFCNGVNAHKWWLVDDPKDGVSQLLALFDDYREEVEVLTAQNRNSEPLHGPITIGIHANWLKDLPMQIAWELSAVQQILSASYLRLPLDAPRIDLRDRVKPVLKNCSKALAAMMLGVRSEYHRWTDGNSALLPLIKAASAFVIDLACEANCVPAGEAQEVKCDAQARSA